MPIFGVPLFSFLTLIKEMATTNIRARKKALISPRGYFKKHAGTDLKAHVVLPKNYLAFYLYRRKNIKVRKPIKDFRTFTLNIKISLT